METYKEYGEWDELADYELCMGAYEWAYMVLIEQ